ncbi:diaminopimelate epimerase [Bdellovibrio bacteriovorus]|uniref:Diaminopimelate epimerase n=1 Tax=Bdellovibrio bacteriovorus TaxID=959 RepID=A0A150WD37_BDEBC|nr:diaminopimelate epimerase [Bdellovibrio bacteriovorus]KYG60788.1 diaminopimelate epimerase [Bdellovibrio bacteriovorus]
MKKLLPISIMKMSGAGNTFALIDAREKSDWRDVENSLGKSRADFAKLVCDRVLGLSTDGFLLIENGSEGFDYDWDFYNSDGSTAEMCGNAARCAARFCYEYLGSSENKASLKFKTGAGLVTAQILGDDEVRVQMPEARFVKESIELKTNSKGVQKFALVNTGVPHLVQKISNLSEASALKEMAREARSHADLKPAGANVTFYAENEKGHINAVTFERGVEDYTLACGTGAVAAALVYSQLTSEKQIKVQMPGGLLSVVFDGKDTHPLMTGGAVFVGEFKYNLEVVG